MQLAYFNHKPSAAVRNTERDTADYSDYYPVKGKIKLLALGSPSLEHIRTDQELFEHTCLHLVLCDVISPTDVENLNKTSKFFVHFHIMILHTEPNTICKSF